MAVGFTLPFARATGSIGYFEVSRTELEAVQNNLRSLLVTNWGERVMHQDFGCNLIQFLFEQSVDDELREQISDRIASQVAKWMPFVNVDDIQLVFPEEDSSVPQNSFRISITFSLSRRPDLSARFVTTVGA